MRYLLHGYFLALVVACASTPPATPPSHARAAAPPTTTTLTLAKNGHTIGTLLIPAGTIGELTTVPLDPDAADLADAWATVRAAGHVSVKIHENPPLVLATPAGAIDLGIRTYSGMGPLVIYTYKPADAKYLEGVARWLALRGVEAMEQPARSARETGK